MKLNAFRYDCMCALFICKIPQDTITIDVSGRTNTIHSQVYTFNTAKIRNFNGKSFRFELYRRDVLEPSHLDYVKVYEFNELFDS